MSSMVHQSVKEVKRAVHDSTKPFQVLATKHWQIKKQNVCAEESDFDSAIKYQSMVETEAEARLCTGIAGSKLPVRPLASALSSSP